ncbi:hypothetical protein Q787_07515 [Ornithobacterium rhinotracheale H06-030791]|nr:hypothetical protein Q785_07615 [Ornithobacterium rhinotracheale ORT-UMN 88]KGB66756.1 hypothetical protein Q787_07515 [Ornithobacterium rhinotracheale H06-030791]
MNNELECLAERFLLRQRNKKYTMNFNRMMKEIAVIVPCNGLNLVCGVSNQNLLLIVLNKLKIIEA